MRKLGRGVLALVALLAVGVLAAWLDIGHIVKTAVEREGTRSLRLETTLDGARVSLLRGTVDLRGLAVASPRGFSARHLLEADDVAGLVSFRALRREPIHVGSLSIDRPRLVLEQSGGAVNLRKAMELLPAPNPEKPPMKLVIDELRVRDAQVVIRPGLPGVRQEIVVQVPELSMKGVGRGAGARNGAAIGDVAMQVMAALADRAAESGRLPPQLKALLHANVAEVAGKLGAEAARRIGAAAGDLADHPADLARDPEKALKGLLPEGRPEPRKR